MYIIKTQVLAHRQWRASIPSRHYTLLFLMMYIEHCQVSRSPKYFYLFAHGRERRDASNLKAMGDGAKVT